jgi:predicted Ser/Thr protein kinase
MVSASSIKRRTEINGPKHVCIKNDVYIIDVEENKNQYTEAVLRVRMKIRGRVCY